jgi:hypothetical protein
MILSPNRKHRGRPRPSSDVASTSDALRSPDFKRTNAQSEALSSGPRSIAQRVFTGMASLVAAAGAVSRSRGSPMQQDGEPQPTAVVQSPLPPVRVLPNGQPSSRKRLAFHQTRALETPEAMEGCTPPTAIKQASIAPPVWASATPTWEEAVVYLLSDVNELEGPVGDGGTLPPLHARALAWRRAAHAMLSGGSLRRFQAEALAHLLLGGDVFTLAPTGIGKSVVFQLPVGVLLLPGLHLQL